MLQELAARQISLQVDLMNGQRTGGEDLAPVCAERTGNAFNAQGVAAHLSKDRLAGSIPAGAGKTQNTKKCQRVAKKHVDKLADALGKALAAQSWAALDNFVPSMAVQAIRKEVGVMEANYTPGEIWVGTSNEVRCYMIAAAVCWTALASCKHSILLPRTFHACRLDRKSSERM
jgi:hypothetical protein